MLKIDRTLLAGTALAFAIGITAPVLAQQSNPGPASNTSPPVMNQSQTGVPSTSGAQGSAQGTTKDDATPGSSTAQGTGTTSPGTTSPGTTSPGMTGQGTTGSAMTAMTEEELKGKDLYGADNQKVGEIDRVLMGPDNKANSVLVDIGGFLGIGAKTVAIPIAQLRAEGDRVVAQNLTKDQARAMPEHKETGEKKM